MDAVRWLMAKGCDINRQSRNGMTPLRVAMLDYDQPKVIAELLTLRRSCLRSRSARLL
jgi:hypothetical protein